MSESALATEERAADAFQSERPRLVGIAYRMTGSLSEAEDIVQDAWLRFAASAEPARSTAALLTTIVTRLSIDHMRSARVRREQYIGPWLPEPIHTSALRPEEDPERFVLTHEGLDYAALVLFERLKPVERAVLVLHEAFGMSHAEISDTVGVSVVASRQHLRRARQRLRDGGQRYQLDPEEHARVTTEFVRAFQRGDVATVTRLLAEDAVLYTDGGGVVAAAPNPIYGRDRILRFVIGLGAKYREWAIELTGINGNLGIATVLGQSAGLDTIAGLEVRDGRITRLHFQRNPEKLTRFGEAIDLR